MMPIKIMANVDLTEIPHDFIFQDVGKFYFDSDTCGKLNYVDSIYDKDHKIKLSLFNENCLDEMLGDICIGISGGQLEVLREGVFEVYCSTNLENEYYIDTQSCQETIEITNYTRISVRIKGSSKEIIVLEIV